VLHRSFEPNKSTIVVRSLKSGKQVKEKVVVTWRKKYEKREKIRRNGAIEYVEKMRPSQMKRILIGKNQTKYWDISVLDENGESIKLNPYINVDKTKIAFDELFDGINVITTSEVDMQDDEIIEAYGQLNKIEDCFRVTKTDLKTRPVNARTKEHIEAHFLTCFVALVVLKVLHHKIKGQMSIGRIIDGQNSALGKKITDEYVDVSANDDFAELMELLGKQWDRRNVHLNEIEKHINTL
jgi:transposase